MIYNAINTFFYKQITPVDDAYLYVEVFDRIKNVNEDNTILLTREGRICMYKVHYVKYFRPHSEKY